MGIDRRSGVGEGEIGDRQEWKGRGLRGGGGGGRVEIGGVGWEGERVVIDRRSGVGGGERGDRVEEWAGRGREWR